MFLPLRLRTIGDLVSPGEKVADIGADHGLLELYLLGKNQNNELVAIENKKGPYENLKKTIGAFKGVRLSMSDGLISVDRDVDCVIIAGMGGLNIKQIIDRRPDKLVKIKKVIIDAHRDKDEARKAVIKNGFKITKEIIVFEDDIFYVITSFEKTKTPVKYSRDEIQFGYKIYEDKLWPNYKDFLIKKNEETIAKIKDQPNLQDKVLELKKTNERLENYGKN